MQIKIAELLIDIESELRTLDLWQNIPPCEKALASDQPFCVDTLTLSQWLQFILLPTLYGLMKEGRELPKRCGVAPMAEEYFKGSELPVDALIVALRDIDIALSSDRVTS
ncbi:MAG: hypothetical protein ACI8QT_001241 [Halioglobus sp.]|jgi:uncharacterized protein YqcC (DUF446 family)